MSLSDLPIPWARLLWSWPRIFVARNMLTDFSLIAAFYFAFSFYCEYLKSLLDFKLIEAWIYELFVFESWVVVNLVTT